MQSVEHSTNSTSTLNNRKILIIDDNESIHRDFQSILAPEKNTKLDELEARILSESSNEPPPEEIIFVLESAMQGAEGVKQVEAALEAKTPFSLAFVDIRMPPGFDGLKTIKKIRELDQEIQIVICSAYSDYSWEEIRREVGQSDNLVILKKPFEYLEVRQLAYSLTQKWNTHRRFQDTIQKLQNEIDNHHLTETSLRQSEDKYKTLIETAQEGVWIIDKDSITTFVNRHMAEMLGYSIEQMLGKHLFSFMDEYARKIAEENLDRRRKGMEENHDFVFRHKQGHYVYTTLSTTPLHDDQGNYDGAFAFINDISERIKTEKELENVKIYLNNILDSMPSVLVGLDVELGVTFWNRQAIAYTGISQEEARGEKLINVFPMLPEILMRDVSRAVGAGEKLVRERIMSRSGENMFYSDITVYPVQNAEGPAGAVLKLDDISDRVKLEEIMIQTEKMMSVGGLAAGMAHEINNPLSGILQGIQNTFRRLSGELAKNKKVAAELSVNLDTINQYLEVRGIIGFLNSIKDSGERASRIVDNMLQFSRGSESKVAPARISDLIDRTLELASNEYNLKKQYDFRHIKIIREYDQNLPAIPCVITEIEQVILNLLKNAAQAMNEPGHIISEPCIRIRTLRQGEDWAVIEIEDNGPGIPEEVRKRVFEPFFTTKDVNLGTGLGLSVSYFIITNNHKGKISVSSSPGKGSVFKLELSLRWNAD